MDPMRLAAVMVLSGSLAACAHARGGASGRAGEEASESAAATPTATSTATATATATSTSTSTPTPTPTSTPTSTATATSTSTATETAVPAPPDPARPPARNVTVVHWPSSPGAGAVKGAFVVLGVFGRVCVAGKAATLLLCALVVVKGWPYLVAATVVGAGIGAAVSSSSGQVQPGRPHEETASAPRPEDPAVALAGGT